MTERFLLVAGILLLTVVIIISIGIISGSAFLVASIWTYIVILSCLGFMSSGAIYFGIKAELKNNTTHYSNGNVK